MDMMQLADTQILIPRHMLEVAGLKLFFRLATDWALSIDEQRALLGNMSRSRYYQLKKAPENAHLSNDELDRLSFIANIHRDLAVMFTAENQINFLKNKQDVQGDFPQESLLDHMMSGIRGLGETADYLDGLHNGRFS